MLMDLLPGSPQRALLWCACDISRSYDGLELLPVVAVTSWQRGSCCWFWSVPGLFNCPLPTSLMGLYVRACVHACKCMQMCACVCVWPALPAVRIKGTVCWCGSSSISPVPLSQCFHPGPSSTSIHPSPSPKSVLIPPHLPFCPSKGAAPPPPAAGMEQGAD